jgi:hypothetical protein
MIRRGDDSNVLHQPRTARVFPLQRPRQERKTDGSVVQNLVQNSWKPVQNRVFSRIPGNAFGAAKKPETIAG